MLLNSLLFVPGNRPERFEKALATGADGVIVDLEDAVAADDKDKARAALAAWLNPAHPVLVRINAPGTPWFEADLDLLANAVGAGGIAGVILPKAETGEDIARVYAAHAAGKNGAENPVAILPLVESALGFELRLELARAPGVSRLVFGTIDFQLDMNMRCSEAELLPFRTALVLASRVAGIAAPIDGVCTAIEDAALLEQETLRARNLGFGGKLCIHPRQVAVVNRCFTPSADELAWASRVVAADAQSGGAAVAVDGRMVDRPVVLRAQAMLREAAARQPLGEA